ncbi:hypothetical protein ACWOBL_08540 [Gemella bergeri]
MKGKIKFHSIFYRCILFMVLFCFFVLHTISNGQAITVNLFEKPLTIAWKQLSYIVIIIFVAVTVISSIANWKFYISKEGIFLRKINLLITWEEIIAINHIWINKIYRPSVGRFFLYNSKTIVIHRENYKPICICNISLLALYVIKFYNPKTKTNITFATLATAFNIALNAVILYEVYDGDLLNMQFEIFMILTGLYAVKSFVLPLLMVRHQNKLYRSSLSHERINKTNYSEAIYL